LFLRQRWKLRGNMIKNEQLSRPKLIEKILTSKYFLTPVKTREDLSRALKETSSEIYAPLLFKKGNRLAYLLEMKNGEFIRIVDNPLFGGVITHFFQSHPQLSPKIYLLNV
jgi:hypothetical protein